MKGTTVQIRATNDGQTWVLASDVVTWLLNCSQQAEGGYFNAADFLQQGAVVLSTTLGNAKITRRSR